MKELKNEDNHVTFSIIAIQKLKSLRGLKHIAFGLYAGLLSCSPKVQLVSHSAHEYVMNDSTAGEIDSTVYKIADPYRTQMVGAMQEVLANSEAPMEKGLPESTLGNWVADVALKTGNEEAKKNGVQEADCIILNNGGLRKALPAGPVTQGDLFELMPFENRLVILTMDGSSVKKIFNFIASKGGTPLSGASFRIKDKTQAIDIRIKGVEIDTAVMYRIMTVDYLANGGDQFTDFNSAVRKEDIGLKLRDALIRSAREIGNRGQLIGSKKDGRITHAE